MKKIPLSRGHFAIVDDEDFDKVSKLKWHVRESKQGCKTLYATSSRRNEGKVALRMHRLIIGAELRFQVDHIDGNGLNNQKSNLRICTHHQNQFNKSFSDKNKSGFKGVSSHQNSEKFRARLKLNGREIHLGLFSDKMEAALAYDLAAVKHFGQFARTNAMLGKYDSVS
jgi:hypothetical protein